MEDILSVTDFIIKRLKKAELFVQRYNSVTSNSIYLILDFGVCNSIRISDHKSKKYLTYKYNVIQGFKGIHCSHSPTGLHRYYYGFENVDIMIKRIISSRQAKISRLGMLDYTRLLDECLKESNKLLKGEDNWQLF